MAAKKKEVKPSYDPAVRERATTRVLELMAQGVGKGVQARVAKELKVPASAIGYWMKAHREQPKPNGSNGHAAPEPAAPPPNGNGHSPAKGLSDALAAYLDPLVEARIDAALARRMQRMMERE